MCDDAPPVALKSLICRSMRSAAVLDDTKARVLGRSARQVAFFALSFALPFLAELLCTNFFEDECVFFAVASKLSSINAYDKYDDVIDFIDSVDMEDIEDFEDDLPTFDDLLLLGEVRSQEKSAGASFVLFLHMVFRRNSACYRNSMDAVKSVCQHHSSCK